jgi:chromosome segregation ATPase
MQTEAYAVRMQTMEENWTDKRFLQVDQRFDRLEVSMAEFRTEVRESNAELRTEIQNSNAALRQGIESSNAALRTEIRHSNAELRSEIHSASAELRSEIQATHTRIDTMQRTLSQVGGGLIGTMIVASAGLIATQI